MSLTAMKIIHSVKVNRVNQSIPCDVISACERVQNRIIIRVRSVIYSRRTHTHIDSIPFEYRNNYTETP